MATFATPRQGLAAALRMRTAMDELNKHVGRDDLWLKVGLHEGPCLAVTLNERQDYFGQTVNIAARLQSLAESNTILTTEAVTGDASTKSMIAEQSLALMPRRIALRGLREEMVIYHIA